MADKRDIRSIGSRKGFDFRIKSQHTKPEVKPFEEFNDDMEFTKPNMIVGVVASTNDKKRKLEKSDAVDASVSNRSSRDEIISSKKKKAYYPSGNLELDLSWDDLGVSHATRLVNIVSEACEQELSALEQYFKQNHPRSGSQILSAVRSLSSKLPEEISRQCPPNAIFCPESSSADVADVDRLIELVGALEEQSEMLHRYETNIDTFGEEHDIWVDGAVVSVAALTPSDNSNVGLLPDSNTADNINLIALRFGEKLQQIESYTTKILDGIQVVEDRMVDSRTIQGKLFASLQQVSKLTEGKAATVSSISVPNKTPSQILRHLQKL